MHPTPIALAPTLMAAPNQAPTLGNDIGLQHAEPVLQYSSVLVNVVAQHDPSLPAPTIQHPLSSGFASLHAISGVGLHSSAACRHKHCCTQRQANKAAKMHQVACCLSFLCICSPLTTPTKPLRACTVRRSASFYPSADAAQRSGCYTRAALVVTNFLLWRMHARWVRCICIWDQGQD